MKPPAFQFYADDFLGGTLNFTDAEVGLYIRLLCVQWSSGGLVDDDAELESYGKGSTSVKRVKAKFKKCEDGLLRNPRLEAERIKQEKYRASRSNNGKHGGRPQKPHGNHMVSQTKAQESSPSPSPLVHTHTGQADVPTLDEVLKQADMVAVTKESATGFFNHHEDNQLWVNQFGKLINWKSKLVSWQSRDRELKPKANDGGGFQKPAMTVFGLTKIIEAKKAQAEGLKSRWAIETGLDTTWSSEQAREDHRRLRGEIKKLNEQLAKMA